MGLGHRFVQYRGPRLGQTQLEVAPVSSKGPAPNCMSGSQPLFQHRAARRWAGGPADAQLLIDGWPEAYLLTLLKRFAPGLMDSKGSGRAGDPSGLL